PAGHAGSKDPAYVPPSQAPTITSPALLTGAGMILGTAAYMSPEQARGAEVDKRADVWAFGVVLWEMLTGARLFEGATVSDTIAAVLKTEPQWSALAPETPTAIRRLLRRCLEKDRKRRLDSAAAVRLEIEEAITTPEADGVEPAAGPSPASRRRLVWMGAVTLAVALASVAITWTLQRQPVADQRSFQFELDPPTGNVILAGAGGGAAVSPDGRTVVFAGASGGTKLWVRRLDSLKARELPGTEGAAYPFWSPDARSVGFIADGSLKKVALSGGPPVVIAAGPIGVRGGSWSADGTIAFGIPAGAIQKVASSGGVVSPLTRLDREAGETAHRWPQFFPDGRHFLYFVRSNKTTRTGLYLGTLDDPNAKTFIVESDARGWYSPPHGNVPAHVLWVRGGALMAQTFDADRGQLSGEPAVVSGAEEVGIIGAFNQSAVWTSQEGTLIFSRSDDVFPLTWLNRDGKAIGTIGSGRFAAVQISPDGRLAAVSSTDEAGRRDIWTMELARGLLNRLTRDTGNVPVWSPDGRQIAYHDSSVASLFTVDVNDAQPMQVLDSKRLTYINDWSPDGRFLLYTQDSPTTGFDLWLLPLIGDRTPVPLLNTPVGESHGQFSPDGEWFSYTSTETGQEEVYVRAMTGKGSARVSTRGGSFSRWRRDGRELFYRAVDGTLMAVSVEQAGDRLTFGTPVPLFPIVEPLGTFAYPYDISADGQRILTLGSSDQDKAPLTVIVNWEAGLRK
ncbi:MAG: protein kinase, partial [Vicinamibacterales bacterium]